MLQNIKFHYTGRLTKYLSFLCLLFICLQSCDATGPNNDLPGRRDYTWTVDSLLADDWFGITDVWGTSPNYIWITASGTSAKDCLWFYDGIKWARNSQPLSSSLNTVFGVTSDEIWIGDSEGEIWRNIGNGWQKFQKITVDGYDRIIIASIYGTSKNNLYAVGGADNYDGSGYKGLILKYDGKDWKPLEIPEIRVGFYKIKKIDNNKYLIAATNFDSGFLGKLFVFDGINNLKEIYSDYNDPVLYQMNGETYIVISQKIYKCKDDKLVLWKDFTGTSYYGTLLGRNEKDYFVAGYDGILHYNGTDLVNLYPTQIGLGGALIFEKDVFFEGYNSDRKYIIIRGTLKE